MNMNPSCRGMLLPSLLLTAVPGLLFAVPPGSGAGAERHGFRLIEKRFVREINAECLYFEHVKSGAKLFKIAAADPNKTFGIVFRTLPDSDCGTPHILEHSVLSGSEKYPVKSPFNILMKGGSLATFLNAMTGDDYTVYPAASMNTHDYFNLMDVYLDAVFHPLIDTQPAIFQREGWHYELASTKAPLTYNGVVYNEMKGSYSNPMRELYRQTARELFPDTPYHYESGGDPAAIPDLTCEKFLDFHRRYYHPSNASIFLYGDADLDRELATLDAVLSAYSRQSPAAPAAAQPPFPAMKTAVATYAVPENESKIGRSYLSLAWVTGNGSDTRLNMELEILSDALVGNEAAPLRQALRQAGIGQECQAASSGNSVQSVFQIIARDANPDQLEPFRKTVISTLQTIVKTGFDAEMLDGILNRLEFHLRENNDARKGLKYGFSMLNYWLATGDPFCGLEYEDDLAAVKHDIRDGKLQQLVQRLLLDNPHALLLAVNPEPGLEHRRTAELAARLAERKQRCSPAELEQLVADTKKQLADQQRKDSPADIAKVPMLTRADLNPQTPWYDVTVSAEDGVPVLHYDTFTNGVVYLRCYFDLRRVPEELLPYAALLRELLGRVDTEKYGWAALDNRLNRDTGGFWAAIDLYLEHRNDRDLVPQFTVAAKTLSDQLPAAVELLDQIVNHSRFDNAARMKELLSRLQSSLEAQLKSDGVGCAMKRIAVYYSRRGVLDDRITGLDFYRFIRTLNADYDRQAPTVAVRLQEVARLLFVRPGLTAAATCGKPEFPAFRTALTAFIPTLSAAAAPLQTWQLTPIPQNEGLLAASQVQFVVQGGNFKTAGFAWNGKLRLLSHLISRDWLWNRLREIGGAYGGYCVISSDGNLLFVSYRDPKLRETLATFRGIPDYLRKIKMSEDDFTRYLIGAVASLDTPLNPSSEGDLGFRRYFEKTSRQEIQQERDELLSATPADFAALAGLVDAVLRQNHLCVYGGEAKLKDNRDLFKTLVPVIPEY